MNPAKPAPTTAFRAACGALGFAVSTVTPANSFAHRKPIVEARIQKLGEIFAVGNRTYAVMSNHVHIVLSVAARAACDWPDEEVARRWLMLYPPKPIDFAARHAEL